MKEKKCENCLYLGKPVGNQYIYNWYICNALTNNVNSYEIEIIVEGSAHLENHRVVVDKNFCCNLFWQKE